MNKKLTKENDIKAWLEQHEIKKYELIKDFHSKYGYIVNVNQDVCLQAKKLKSIPIKFNYIGGKFDCSHNELSSLDFCPDTVAGHFDCSHNKIKTLEFGPKKVAGDYNCSFNNLINLEHLSAALKKEINGEFDCSRNKLTSLKFGPKSVVGNFHCGNNKLTSLEFGPQKVGGCYEGMMNRIKTLEFFPEIVGLHIMLLWNKKIDERIESENHSQIYKEHLIDKEKAQIKREKAKLNKIILPISISMNVPKKKFKI